MWNPFVLLLIWLSELLLWPKCWLFERKIWQEWDSNPGTHSCIGSLRGEFLESGALDRSAILPWVNRTCFILSSITPSCNVKSAPSCSWFDCQKYCFDQNVSFLNAKFDMSGIRYCFDWNVAFLNAKFDRSGIRTHAHIRVPEVSKENFLTLAP